MKITEDELLAIIEEVTATLGQILLTHRELTEALFDQTQTRVAREKIDAVKDELRKEKERLASIQHAQHRKRELEKLRQDQDNATLDKAKQNEGKHASRMTQLLNGQGKLIGWIQPTGKNMVSILNSRGVVVAREIDSRTFDAKGRYRGNGKQGIRLLGKSKHRLKELIESIQSTVFML